MYIGKDVQINFQGDKDLYLSAEDLRKTLKRAERTFIMDHTTINPKPNAIGIDPPPFRIDDSEFKFKYFWWWFTKDKPFTSIHDKLPENERYIEIVLLCPEDNLPMNMHVYARKNMIISYADMDKDFIKDVPKPIRGAQYWRYRD